MLIRRETARHCGSHRYEFVQRSYRNRVLGALLLLYISLGNGCVCFLGILDGSSPRGVRACAHKLCLND